MTQKKSTTTTKTNKKPTVAELEAEIKKDERRIARDKTQLANANERITALTIGEDLRNSVLIVSLLINFFILIAWVTMQFTTQYDYAVSAFIFGR